MDFNLAESAAFNNNSNGGLMGGGLALGLSVNAHNSECDFRGNILNN